MRFIAFVACLTLMACPSSEPVGGNDSGSGGADSGVTATDSGSVAADVAVPHADSGQPVVTNDSGPVASDDAGAVVVEQDAGAVVVEQDADAGQGTTCVEAMECVLECDPTSRSCPQQCLTNVDPSQRTEAEAVFRCAQRNECTGFQCLMQNCQNEAQACGEAGGGGPGPGGADGGMGPPPEGNLTCAEFLTCADACGPRDQNCMGTCSDGVRRESNQLSNALIQCMMRNRCMDLDCGRRSCPEEAAACVRDVR